MTHLIASISGETIVEVRERIGHAIDAGADMIELRVDLMEGVSDEDLLRLRENAPPGVPIILTIRSSAEGGEWDGSDMDRISRLIDLGQIANYIDVEWEAWQRSANIRQKIGLALQRHEGAEAPRNEGNELRKLILSRHDFRGRPTSLHSDLLGMTSTPDCDVPKIAWRARTVRDNFEAFELMRDTPKPIIAICMGEEGLPSRVLAKKFGAFGSFASIAAGHETAAGQLSLDQFRKTYRWDRINPSTKVYGLIGDPVAQSLGAVLHNAAFEHLGHNGVYLPFKVAAGYESFKAFMVELLARPWMDAAGFSVTIPHKENAFRYLTERGEEIDAAARDLRAVNTLEICADGSLRGSNTDAPALLTVIADMMEGPAGLRGVRAAVLGAGGVARAAVASLVKAGAEVTIYNRTPDRAQALAQEMNCRWSSWEERVETGCRLVLQCTSVGMVPAAEQTPVPTERLIPEMTIVETIYRPRETRLLREARARGCRTVEGLEMFLSQAQGQLECWTGQRIELDRLRAWLERQQAD
jgi:3-dehydroquinate dehydratase/shikimate dehydrogenase